jgi:hypothetical protein
MPTEFDFVESARTLERVAAEVETVYDEPRRLFDDAPLVGGALGFELAQLLTGLQRAMQIKADDLREVARTCRTRAQVVADHRAAASGYAQALDEYQTDLAAWQRQFDAWLLDPSLPEPGPTPVAPAPPESPPLWVEL